MTTFIEEGYTPYPHDPYGLYRNQAIENSTTAKGVERLAYRIFGYDVIASFAFAINPLASFAVDPRSRRGLTRKRSRNVTSTALTRETVTHDLNVTTSKSRSLGKDIFAESVLDSGPKTSTKVTASLIPEFTVDTTDALRFPWESGGTFEKFNRSYSSRFFQFTRVNTTYNEFPAAHQWTLSTGRKAFNTRGPFAYLSTSSQNQLLNNEKTNADYWLNEKAYSMLSRSLPTSPRFSLLRSIVELKDVPSLRHLPEAIRRRSFEFKDIGDVYLSKEFGIDPLISDIRSMLDLPEKVAKKFNFLKARSGKETTYRSTIRFPDNPTTHPSFSVGDMAFPGASMVSNVNSITRDVEMRSAIKAVFTFPDIEVPKFNRKLFYRLLGANPTFTALYELTPWTWLIDWFSGLGDYIELIDSINQDPSLINEGWLTYQSYCKMTNLFTQRITQTDNFRSYPSPKLTTIKTYDIATQTDYDFSYTKRVSYSDLGVSTVQGSSNLTGFQSLILGALFAQRV